MDRLGNIWLHCYFYVQPGHTANIHLCFIQSWTVWYEGKVSSLEIVHLLVVRIQTLKKLHNPHK